MKYKLGILVLLFNIGANANSAHGTNQFEFKVRIPATVSGCVADAQNLATKFSLSAPNIYHAHGRCVASATFVDQGQTFTVDTIVVNYDSNSELKIYTATISESEESIANPFGSEPYPTYKSCIDDLADQARVFLQATKLQPLALSCEPKNSDYALVIEAVGTSRQNVYQFVDDAAQIAHDDQWFAWISNKMQSAGAHITKKSGNSVFYYAKRPINISSHQIVRLYSVEQCEAQRDEAVALYRQLGAENSLAACHTQGLENQKVGLDILTTIEDTLYSDYGAQSTVYFSFQDCMEDRASIERKAKASGVFPFATFCAADDLNPGKFLVESFQR